MTTAAPVPTPTEKAIKRANIVREVLSLQMKQSWYSMLISDGSTEGKNLHSWMMMQAKACIVNQGIHLDNDATWAVIESHFRYPARVFHWRHHISGWRMLGNGRRDIEGRYYPIVDSQFTHPHDGSFMWGPGEAIARTIIPEFRTVDNREALYWLGLTGGVHGYHGHHPPAPPPAEGDEDPPMNGDEGT